MNTIYQEYNTDALWKADQTNQGFFGSITKDKIALGIFAVTALAIAGAVMDSGYSVGLGNGSMHLFPGKNNPFKLN